MQNPKDPASAPADPGFRLPNAASAPPIGPFKGGANGGTSPLSIEIAPMDGAPVTDTSTRDLAIGGAVFLVLLIGFFFVRNAYVHHLVVKRVAPSSAGSAGWLMFVGLSLVSAAGVLAVINPGKFLTMAITATLVVVGLIAIIAALFVGRR
ncbi:hypothetical protein CR152_13620 [Massilia violaceinigra]|uniref:Uncharacterized protein n=1 Tax=Massilia violaceinigra TaxID=2045208 RepID=A0A2D2DKG2_9BURK|nr:hypothetical protein [Massilia violaceinigra]ATQ75442.1 hypothetical protein CR152_13620 [Massilia violaceinigra]